MSKKRLEEIPYNVRISLHDDENVLIKREDYEFLYEQAEKVQELENKLLHMKGKYIGFKGECKKELLHLIEENKRYRDLLKKIHRLAGINKEIDHDLWKLVRDELEGEK